MVAHLFIDLFTVTHNLLHHFPILIFLQLHTVFINQNIGLAAAKKARFGAAEAGFQIPQFRTAVDKILQPCTRRLHFTDTFRRSRKQCKHDRRGGSNHKGTRRNQKLGRR